MPQLNSTFKDFAWTENHNINTKRYKEAENFWTSKFNESIPILRMPTNFSRPLVKSYVGSILHEHLPADITLQIQKYCKELNITPYIFTITAYYILLYNYTAQNDIVIGSPVNGRNYTEIQNIVGMFVNTVPIRLKIDTS